MNTIEFFKVLQKYTPHTDVELTSDWLWGALNANISQLDNDEEKRELIAVLNKFKYVHHKRT